MSPLPLTWSLAVVDPRLVQGREFLSQERTTRLEQAAELLAPLRAYCEQVPNRRLLMEVEALDGLFYARRGHHARALESLRRVVLTAETDGWVRLFVDLGSEMERLLTQLAAQGVAPHYIAHILAAFPVDATMSAPQTHNGQPELIELLSEREVEVLTLLAQRYSNKEIAAGLFIAPATVKRHTRNIYRKLDVSDRRQAAAGALPMTNRSQARPASPRCP